MTGTPHTDDEGGQPAEPAPGPDLREAVRDYVRSLHGAYLEAGGGRPDAALSGEPFTVVAAAATSLHLLATRDDLDVELPPEVAVEDTAGDLRWQVVFVDSSLAPELADVEAGPDEIAAVKEVLGVEGTLYHLAVGAGSALSSHHAMHAGTGLAHRETGGGAS